MGIQGTSHSPVGQAKRQAQQAAHEAKPWVERLARFGYAAKGVVYTIIGVLAVQAAMGPGGKTTDQEGALRTILGQPFGKFLLGVVAVGLAGYALWRLVQAALDVENKGTDAKGVVKRIGYALSGLAYGALAFTAAQMIIGSAGGNDKSTQDWTAEFLAKPFGRWLVGAAGLVVIGLGLNALYVAYSEKFKEKLKLAEIDPTMQRWVVGTGRLGLTARGVIFGMIGVFLIQAAWKANANEARGLEGAFKVLAQQPYGPWLLGIVAAGFVAYGAYMFVEARYRRISVP